MGAKPAAGKKSKKAKAAKVPKDEAEVKNEQDEAVRKGLTLEADGIFKRTVKEDHDFNEFQQQREKLNYFWIVEKKKLEDKKAELRNKERELQDLEEMHQVEVKMYKQRVKHLLHEHEDETAKSKAATEAALKMEQDDHRGGEAELKTDRRALKLSLKEMELSQGDHLRGLKHELDRGVTLLREEFERRASEVHKASERRMKLVRERMEARRKQQTADIEAAKSAHVERLMRSHEKALAEIKNYYNDITHNNLDLIKSLKEEVAEVRRREQADEKVMYEVAQENKKMSEPLRRARQDVERLREELSRYRVEQHELRAAKATLLVAEDRLRARRWEAEVLGQRLELVRRERDELHARFHSAVFEAQRRGGFKGLLLEKRLDALGDEAEKAAAGLAEVLEHTGLGVGGGGNGGGGGGSGGGSGTGEGDGGVGAEGGRRRLEDVLEEKAQMARDLSAEVARITSAHARLVAAAHEKLQEFGVPADELGFDPLPPGTGLPSQQQRQRTAPASTIHAAS